MAYRDVEVKNDTSDEIIKHINNLEAKLDDFINHANGAIGRITTRLNALEVSHKASPEEKGRAK